MREHYLLNNLKHDLTCTNIHTHTKTLFTAGEKEGVCEAAGADTTLRWLTVSLTKVVAN